MGGLGLVYGSSPCLMGGLEPFIDLNISEKWDIELGAGGGLAYYAPAFWANGAMQYDPPSVFQVNLGLVFGVVSSSVVLLAPDVSVGWVW